MLREHSNSTCYKDNWVFFLNGFCGILAIQSKFKSSMVTRDSLYNTTDKLLNVIVKENISITISGSVFIPCGEWQWLSNQKYSQYYYHWKCVCYHIANASGNQTIFGLWHDSLNSLNSVKVIWRKVLWFHMLYCRKFDTWINQKFDNLIPPLHCWENRFCYSFHVHINLFSLHTIEISFKKSHWNAEWSFLWMFSKEKIQKKKNQNQKGRLQDWNPGSPV